MVSIREKRKYFFQCRRITPDIIRDLASIFEQEAANQRLKGHQPFSILYSVDAADNSSYESQSVEIFKKNGIIEKKNISKINVRFNTVDFSENMELQISHVVRDEEKSNYIVVSGEDPTWVNGVMGRLTETIEQAEAQPKRIETLGYLIWLLIVGFNIVFFTPLGPFLTKNKDTRSALLIVTKVFLVFGIPIASLYAGSWANECLKRLFPTVEIQAGPLYAQMEKSKRNKVAWVFSVVFLPLFLASLYDFLKHFII